jgi:NAD(P)-dependent dehydrogenase (short-subunit alcohol dehydrogenase family)
MDPSPGAGGGLGRAYALALAARGGKVVINDLGKLWRWCMGHLAQSAHPRLTMRASLRLMVRVYM